LGTIERKRRAGSRGAILTDTIGRWNTPDGLAV